MLKNEELALLVKQGDQGAAADLWKQNQGILYRLMSRYFPLCNAAVSREDLLQSAYFALMCAVKAYEPSKGYAFVSYLSYNVRNAAREAFGFKGGNSPSPIVVYLSTPIAGVEDGSITIGDSIEDEAASAAMEGIQDDWEREQLRACLDDYLCDLAPEQAAVIRARYYEAKGLQTVADESGSTAAGVRLLEEKALRALRTPKYKPRLSSFLDAADCKGYGLEAFKNRGYVSMVEVKAGTY